MKQAYIDRIDRLMAASNDLPLLDLIERHMRELADELEAAKKILAA